MKILKSLIFSTLLCSGVYATNCKTYFKDRKNGAPNARKWCQQGEYFSWKTPGDLDTRLQIFSNCQGDPRRPAIVMVHGYPTSSFDFQSLFKLLGHNFYVCALDTPGYGFSQKPKENYDYSLFDDAKLLDYFVTHILKLNSFALLTHDKGNSVGLQFLGDYLKSPNRPYRISHHFISNGNIYLRLANLTVGQNLLLNQRIGPIASSFLRPKRMANSMVKSTFVGPVSQEEISDFTSLFDFEKGHKIQHQLIQYLAQRRVHELQWLEYLKTSRIPTTLIWGKKDQIAPVQVSDYVWKNYLENTGKVVSYWKIGCAGHYLQIEQAPIVSQLIKAALKNQRPMFTQTECQIQGPRPLSNDQQ